ncbi:MAG: hypothetical protein AB9900_03560 [Humidesulfovibrio sp.]
MNARTPPPSTAPAVPLLLLALASAFVLFSCAPAWASGALPWLAPGQEDNASAASPAAATQAKPPAPPAAIPDDAAANAQYEVLRQFFHRQLTLDEDFPEVFSRRVKDGETLAFRAVRDMQRRRGTLERFRAAQVDLSGLTFTRVTADPDLARIRVTGRYSLSLGSTVREVLDEDALFVLLPEMGQWKIFERRAGWRP